MKFKIVLSFFFSILLLISCNNADKQDKTVAEVPNDSIGRYLYLANSGVLHTSDSCYKLLIDKDSKGHEVIGYEFIDTMTVHDLNCLYCKQCFSGSNCINYKSYKKFIDELNSENYNIAISEGNYNE